MPKENKYKANVRLTSQDIASYCQVSKSTVLTWIKNGDLHAFSLPSGHYRIDKNDFREFLNKWNMPIHKWLFEDNNGEVKNGAHNKTAVQNRQDNTNKIRVKNRAPA